MSAGSRVTLLAGAGLGAYGAWLTSQAAGAIVGGALLLAGVLLRARRELPR